MKRMQTRLADFLTGRKNAVDPLSAIERIRGAFRAAGRVGSFTIPVYGGARRFDLGTWTD